MARDGDRNLFQFDIILGQQLFDGGHHPPFIHDRTVNDDFRLKLFDRKLLQCVSPPMFFHLNQFDAARPDIEAQELPL